jgi:diguanylate cyclase (GGDEF)-like protein/PAS domain S-box-containing protein
MSPVESGSTSPPAYQHMKNYKSKNVLIPVLCFLLLIVFFITDLAFGWTAGGVLYVLVIMLSLSMTKDKHVYFFAIMTSLLLLISWRLSPSSTKIWHVSMVLIWVTVISGLRFKKVRIMKAALAAIVDSSLDAVVGKTLANIVVSWNKAAEDLFGYASAEIVGQSANCLVPEERIGDERRLLHEIGEGKPVKHFQTVCRHKDGHPIPISLSLSPIKDPFGNIVGISSIMRDITDRITAERELKELNDKVALERKKIRKVLAIEEHLNSIFEINKLIDFVVDKTTEVLEAQKCSLIIVDYDTRELCVKGHKGISPWFILGNEFKKEDSVAGIIAHEGKPLLVDNIETDKRFLRKKGDSYHSKSFISAPIRLGGNIMGFINVADKNSKEGNVFSDLDLKILCMIVRQVAVAMENSRLYRDLKNLTITDPLTQINNFRHFTKALDHEIVRLKRHPGRPLCLLMIDVDDFKAYNDAFGHLAGDTLLKEISRVFKQSIREVDIVCRYAGDEFAVILPETDLPKARMVSERIKDAVEALSLKRAIFVSVGIAKCTTHNTGRYELIQSADIALAKAKKEKKNMSHSLG